MEKKKLPVSFKLALLLFFISLQCFLGALYLKEREDYYRLEAQLAAPAGTAGATRKTDLAVAGTAASPAEIMGPVDTASPAAEEAAALSGVSKAPEEIPSSRKPSLPDLSDVKKKGTLWLDKSKDKYVITIGMRNGLKEGDRLKIYDYDEVIGEAKVVKPMEKLSIVEISESDKQNLTKSYYKVSLE
jgi:hypothetical protein